MIPAYPFPIKEIGLSPSGQIGLGSCNNNWHFNKIWKGQRDDASLPGEVGQAMHKGYQEWLRTGNATAAQYAMMAGYPTHLNAEHSDFRSMEACYRSLERAIQSNQMVEYEIATIRCDDGTERPAIEVPFELEIVNFDMGQWQDEDGELHDIRVVYRGVIDVILFSVLKHGYGVTDIKTHRRNLNDMKPVYQFDEQCVPYGIVLQNMIGKEFRGMTVGYLSVYIDIMYPKVEFYEFYKSTEDIQDWARGLWLDLQTIRQGLETGWWRRRSPNCSSFNSICKNAKICTERNLRVLELMMPDERAEHKYPEPWIKVELDLAATAA